VFDYIQFSKSHSSDCCAADGHSVRQETLRILQTQGSVPLQKSLFSADGQIQNTLL